MKVTVEYLGYIRKLVGEGREEEIEVKDGSTVADLLASLAERHGASFRKAVYEPSSQDIKPGFIATVNGYLLNQLDGVRTKLKDADRVILMPVVSGG